MRGWIVHKSLDVLSIQNPVKSHRRDFPKTPALNMLCITLLVRTAPRLRSHASLLNTLYSHVHFLFLHSDILLPSTSVPDAAGDPVVPLRVALLGKHASVLLRGRRRCRSRLALLLLLLLTPPGLFLSPVLLLSLLPVVQKENEGQGEEHDDEALGDAVVLDGSALGAAADGVIEYVLVVRVVVEQLVVLQEVGDPLAEGPVLLGF